MQIVLIIHVRLNLKIMTFHFCYYVSVDVHRLNWWNIVHTIAACVFD